MASPRKKKPALDEGLLQILNEAGELVSDIPEGLGDDELVTLYRWMRFMRVLDDRMLALQRQGRISFYGACTGQEAAVMGSGLAAQEQDWIFPALREGGVALLRGFPFESYIAQLFGNAADSTGGRQMPCHYSDPSTHFVSLSSPIANQIPQAVGAAMAAQVRGDDAVVLSYMGDGATSEGDFHVALNMAGLRKAPVVFCCQNNQWAISVPGHRQTASKTLAIKARAYGFPGIRVDGNDALAVYAATRDAVNRARAGEGPTLLEFLTYRVGAHSTSDDPSRYRDESITEEWKGRCPVERMQRFLVARGCWTEAEEEALVHTTVADIKDAVKRHENMENPPPSSLFDDVYAVLPWHLEEQRESMMQTLEKPDVR